MGRNKKPKSPPMRSKLKKDPGVPKLPDLKYKKSLVENKKDKQRIVPRVDVDSPMASEPTLSSLAALAEESEAMGYAYEQGVNDPSSSTAAYKVHLKRQYIRTLHKVIDESDIILLVLDARDPLGCRSRLVEEEVLRREHEGKHLVFILNKIDLIPKNVAQAWLRYLRHTTPTLPFRASTQQQRTNLNSRTSPALLNLLKSFKSGAKMKSVTVGVVGYPNVGKSSIINSLKRARVCAVAAEAGHTKEMQSIQVERGVRILDSPGVVFDDGEQEAGNILLRNVIKVENIEDPTAVVDQILAKTDRSKLATIYELPPTFNTTEEFLWFFANKSGRFLPGGRPDLSAAARQVIQDWNSQKIPYWSEPPAVHPSSVPSTVNVAVSSKFGLEQGAVAPGAEDVGSVQIVSQLGPAFSLGDLFSQADAGAFDFQMQDETATTSAPEEEMLDVDRIQQNIDTEQSNAMDADERAPPVPQKRRHSPASRSPPADRPIAPLPGGKNPKATSSTDPEPPTKRLRRSLAVPEYDLEHTPGLAKNHRKGQRVDAKRARKAGRRAAARAAKEMQVDVEDSFVRDGGLAFTFMGSPDGMIHT